MSDLIDPEYWRSAPVPAVFLAATLTAASRVGELGRKVALVDKTGVYVRSSTKARTAAGLTWAGLLAVLRQGCLQYPDVLAATRCMVSTLPTPARAKPTDQEVWDAYRKHPDHQPHLAAAGLAGPDDALEAMGSDAWVLRPEDDLEADGTSAGGIRLGSHVRHTIMAFEAAAFG